jgi:hypothetical protein
MKHVFGHIKLRESVKDIFIGRLMSKFDYNFFGIINVSCLTIYGRFWTNTLPEIWYRNE